LNKVFFARIVRGNEKYSKQKLGAFGSDLEAVASFFERPWSKLSTAFADAVVQALLFDEAAFCLRALGRLTEALDLMRVVTKMTARLGDFRNAANDASNLSELELTLGEVALAVADAEQSVTYADRSGDAFMREVTRTIAADALHQAGRRAELETLFREAEQMQKARQPAYPLLYSARGFKYCELLLVAPERAAWQQILSLNSQPSTLNLSERCRAVSQRAAQMLKWLEGRRGAPLLDFALHHLTLGRAALYAAILSARSSRREEAHSEKSVVWSGKSEVDQSLLTSAATEIDAAVAGLRRASTTHELPRGLLTRACLRFLTGARTGSESAQEDLDEAWETAERGSMKLFLAEIHLYRARLFFREQEYPKTWISPHADLAEARRLIEKCGYGRRKEELEDAEAGLRQQHS